MKKYTRALTTCISLILLITALSACSGGGSRLVVGPITGPDILTEFESVQYSIDASGESGITYQWAVEPTGIVEMMNSTSQSPTITAPGLFGDSKLSITVVVNSENGNPVLKLKVITVANDLNSYSGYLGGGHPIDGVNYHRNNRSTYTFPVDLSGGDVYEPPYERTDTTDERYNSLVLDAGERLCLGSYSFWNDWDYCFSKDFYAWSFEFGHDAGDRLEGGFVSALTASGFLTLSLHYDACSSHHPPYYWESHSSSLFKFNNWPIVDNEIEDGCGWTRFSGTPSECDYRRLTYMLPLPDSLILIGFSRGFEPPTYAGHYPNPPIFIQVLDHNLDAMHEFEFAGAVLGFAYDPETAVTYVSTKAGLYSYDHNFNERWFLAYSVTDYESWERNTDGTPVIMNDHSILVCPDGVLHQVGYDGSMGPVADDNLYLRPVILNDGTIAAISDSSIRLYNNLIELTDEIPLPSGPDTGSQYTRPPLVDANDNLAIFLEADLFIIDRNGNPIASRAFESEVRELRLGPDHLFVALDYSIFRFGN